VIFRTTRSGFLRAVQRLDAGYICSPGTQAQERIVVAQARGLNVLTLGGSNGIADIWAPNRFTRAYASSSEPSVPYLRPYDVFEYLPQAADYLSVERTKQLDRYRLEAGMILQSCSGRNLGPAVMVDQYLKDFVLSHDMIRIDIRDPEMAFYVLGYLNTPTAQALLRRDKTGSVIDHISPSHVQTLVVPLLEAIQLSEVAAKMERAVSIRSQARCEIADCIIEYGASLPAVSRSFQLHEGWTQSVSTVGSRLDVAPYDPQVLDMRNSLLVNGGRRLGDLAQARIPGRYVRYYVSEEFGTPILSGRQLLQVRPVNLRYISERSFRDSSKYELRSDWLAMQGEGRAEERIGFPVIVTPNRDGWLANNHILRIVPRYEDQAGALFLAMASAQAQIQVKALATGSVVDAVNPRDFENVVVPPLDAELGTKVLDAWHQLASADAIENEVVALIESGLSEIAGESQIAS